MKKVSNKYEKRIVLFLDILGFKTLLNKTVNDNQDNEKEILNLYDSFKSLRKILTDEFELNKDFENYSIQLTQFSDSIVISFIDDDNTTLLYLIKSIQRILMFLASREILCRGGISFGKLIHNSEVVFGPALVQAYEMETKAAIYPRVILDKSLIEQSKTNQLKLFQFDLHKEKLILNYLKKDSDDKLYIEFIPEHQKFYKNNSDMFSYYKTLKIMAANGMKSENIGVSSKYGWLKNKIISSIQKSNLDVQQKENLLEGLKIIKI